MSRPAIRICVLCAVLPLAVFLAGCEDQGTAQQAKPKDDAVVFYCDGSGGGGKLVNWAGGLQRGLRAGGYTGEFIMFPWNTGRGVLPDHTSSVVYKREKAQDLARQIVAYRQAHPNAAITVMGLSAGTAVAVFTLEALPPDFQVDHVILLSSSLSHTYDLTAALRHVRNRMGVTVSDNDHVLMDMVPKVGSADGVSGPEGRAGGWVGFSLPYGASDETRYLYHAKLNQIRWRPQFRSEDWDGSHLGSTDPELVKTYIAPLVKTHENPYMTGRLQGPQ